MGENIITRVKAILLLICMFGIGLIGSGRLVSAASNENAKAEVLTNQTQVVYNSQNGLPTSEANSVCQTQDGYLWIGSYGGLLRYDGVRFTNFSKEKGGIDCAGIRTLFEDKDGVLWIGTNDKGVYSYSNSEFKRYKSDRENFSSVRCFTQAMDGTLYVGTATGLAKVNGDTLETVPITNLKNQTIYSLTTDKYGAVWGSAGAGYAFAIHNDELAYWFEAGDLSEYENYVVLADENKIYIGTSANLLLSLTLFDDKYSESSYSKECYTTGEYDTLNALCKTRDGSLWIGTNDGPAYFDSNMDFHFAEHLSEDTFITGICEDYEGNIWLASTKYGVFQVIYSKFFQANEQAGLEGKGINAVCCLDGKIYAGSDTGLSILDENWNPVNNALEKQLNGIRIRSLTKDTQGNLWISTYSDYALLRYTPTTQEILSITQEDGLTSNRIRTALPLSGERLAVATTEGLSIIKDTKVIETYSSEQGLSNGTILSLLEEEDGTLLAGSDGDGIYAIKDGKVEHLGTEQGLDSGVVLRMEKDSKAQGIWISAGSELYFMKDEKITKITAFSAGTGSIFDIKVREKDIWLLKSSGVIIVPREALLQQKSDMPIIEYGMENGLTGDIMANSWNYMENDVLYVCTGNGISLLKQNDIRKNQVPPKTAINLVTVTHENGEKTEYRSVKEVRLASSDKRLSIQFAVLSFDIAPSMVEYYMEGFDKEKTSISVQEMEMASYTNLKGGKYTFHLTATNADGVYNDIGTDLVIIKEKGILEYNSIWVLIGLAVILFGVLLTGMIMNIKMKRIKKRQQEYKKITDQALQTIANTIDAKDKYTKGHSVRVAEYSRELARKMGLPVEEQEQIYYIALLHDIGKIGIPDAILNKPQKLTDEEYEIIQSHTTIGANILKDFTALPNIGDGAAGHHENFDGSGYPQKKKADELPLVAQIIRVTDSYDAMSTKRAYREPLSKEDILKELRNNRGIEYEPRIEKLMEEMIESGFTTSDLQEGCKES